MFRIAAAAILFCAPVALLAIRGDIVLPIAPVITEPDPPPTPRPEIQPIDKLAAGQWYVIESTSELIALQSPEGVVTINRVAGPIMAMGHFVDGNNMVETRTFSSPFVYFVSAETSGKVELILIPVGVSEASDIVRQVLTVSGVGPQPPPEPDPDIDPEPDPTPQPVVSFRVIFVKESGDTLNSQQTAIPGAKAIREYLTAKTTPEGGLAGWREYDPQQTTDNEQPAIKALWAAVKSQLLPAPCLVVEINGHATVMPFPLDVDDALKILKKYGGE